MALPNLPFEKYGQLILFILVAWGNPNLRTQQKKFHCSWGFLRWIFGWLVPVNFGLLFFDLAKIHRYRFHINAIHSPDFVDSVTTFSGEQKKTPPKKGHRTFLSSVELGVLGSKGISVFQSKDFAIPHPPRFSPWKTYPSWWRNRRM